MYIFKDASTQIALQASSFIYGIQNFPSFYLVNYKDSLCIVRIKNPFSLKTLTNCLKSFFIMFTKVFFETMSSNLENSARSEEFTTANNNDFHVNFIKIHFTYSSQEVQREKQTIRLVK